MKNRPIFLLLTGLSLCLFACQKEENTINTLLEQAETLMEESPGEALLLLEEVESPETLPKRQYAQWCLLSTQAKDKTYQTPTSDSLIRIAVSYFEKTKETEYLMKSYYYTAAIYHELNDAPRAQAFYLKALDICKTTDNHSLLARIYGNLACIYAFQDLYSEALRLEKKALKHYTYVNEPTNTGRALQNIGRIYAITHQTDSAFFYYTQALSFLTFIMGIIRNGIYSELTIPIALRNKEID